MSKKILLHGQKFGRLQVIIPAPNHKGRTAWKCRCSCGNVCIVLTERLRAGITKSCGCLQLQKRKMGNPIHGGRHTKAYRVWENIKTRCNNPNNSSYAHYGGRGIQVCKEWGNFPNFLADMGQPPDGKTLDRIDVNKGYYKENCRWVTKSTQCRNTRWNRMIEWRGETKCLADWADDIGIPYHIFQKRYYKGKTMDEIEELGWKTDRRTRSVICIDACKGLSNAALESGAIEKMHNMLHQIDLALGAPERRIIHESILHLGVKAILSKLKED